MQYTTFYRLIKNINYTFHIWKKWKLYDCEDFYIHFAYFSFRTFENLIQSVRFVSSLPLNILNFSAVFLIAEGPDVWIRIEDRSMNPMKDTFGSLVLYCGIKTEQNRFISEIKNTSSKICYPLQSIHLCMCGDKLKIQ